MDLNRFGLDTVLAAGTESLTPEVETSVEPGTESITEEQLGAEIHQLVEANESLDRMLHTGLTDGLESVSETLKMIQLSDAFHTMEAIAAGTESYYSDMSGLESALRFAGVDFSDVAGYEAGMEAREGGAAQYVRDAGSKIKGSKAYKAVSDTWVGRTASAIAKKIRSIWNWIVEKIMGKPIQNAHKVMEAALKEAGIPTDAITKPYQDRVNELTSLRDQLVDTRDSQADEIDALKAKNAASTAALNDRDAEISGLKNVVKQLQALAEKDIQQIRKLESKVSKLSSSVDSLVDTRDSQADEIYSLKQSKASADLTIEDRNAEIAGLKRQNAALKERESALMSGNFELGKELADIKGKMQASEKVAKTIIDSLVKKVDGMTAHHKKEVLKLVQQNKTLDEAYLKVCSKIAQIKAAFNPSGKTTGTPKAGRSRSGKRKGVESEYLLEDLIGFTAGAESMIETFEDETAGMETLGIADIEMGIAACAMLDAIDAGIECMNIDVFGHPYTGADMRTMRVFAFTDHTDIGEAGTEAEETAKEEKPSDTAKSEEAKEDGFFAKAGAKFKKAGKWVGAKGRQFWKWLKSKLTILEPIMDRLAMMTSKSFDLSTLNESELGNSLATMDANLEKVAKLLDKEHKEEVKSAEDYTKIIADSKKKVSSAITVSPIRLIGASDLLKKIRKISKAVKKAEANKVENAAEMTSIMTETNKAMAAFNLQIRRALRNVAKANDATKDIPDNKE